MNLTAFRSDLWGAYSMAKFETVSIDNIKPADYNPRKILNEQFESLKNSILDIGFVIPILINKANNVIIAGHQRTKAATALGFEKVPCIYVDNLVWGDEIKFNQLHNGCESDKTAEGSYTGKSDVGFCEAKQSDFKITGYVATVVKEICKLILKYGNTLCAVCAGNKIVVGHNYIKACQLLNQSVNLSVIDADKYAQARKYLLDDYGVYSYESIERNTYVQGLAQLNRKIVKTENIKRHNFSTLYSNHVIPYLQGKDKTILDFGCGKGAYISELSKKYDALGVEFYNNNGSQIDVAKGNTQINKLIQRIENKGFFDVVVCDSVLNSVDSVEAEQAVVRCCNLFTKDRLFISGRPIETYTNKLTYNIDRNAGKRLIEFLDENKFTALYRKGNWYFQHWHSKEDVEKLLTENGFKIIKMTWCKYGDSWQVEAQKIKQLPLEIYQSAIDFEFNLPLPCDKRYGRNEEVKKAVFKWL